MATTLRKVQSLIVELRQLVHQHDEQMAKKIDESTKDDNAAIRAFTRLEVLTEKRLNALEEVESLAKELL